ncbi:hypothetical protein Poly51_19340 [Rubripirellula tenax]|uniref:Uncharacterized protein n=1 Tax=Rubripirellula tenax TaxID=2528015 RepID=A0A5C6FCG7_9BACT|nr:hypothetical protein [Rubripirellula tenax]TWU59148.1 hypothetical protein Poly51_19340 [Rubripirellula tenax]
MSTVRRTNDRRRRVLYSSHQADQTTSTAASRREFERLREARRPTAAYGVRVQRRLRGRWFSLVPVKRRTYTILASALSAATLLFCVAHYLTEAWPALLYRPEIARPFRLDASDSFGRWFMVTLLAASAGVALMTYQLRRYRLDDYLGRYRLWRLVLIVLVLACVNAGVGLIDWTGSLLDLAFGKRVALTGGDWLRVVIGLSGAIVLLRMVAEMHRCRSALIAMIAVCGAMAFSQAAQWNVVDDGTILRWTAVTSAPLVGSTALFIAMSGYLRMLYREVREIDDGMSLRDRLEQMRLRVFTREPNESETETSESAENEKTKRNRNTEATPSRAERRELAQQAKAEAVAKRAEATKTKAKAKSNSNSDSEDENTNGELKRGWFGRLRHKPPVAPEFSSAATEPGPEPIRADNSDDDEANAKPKRRWFGLRAAKSDDNATDENVADTEAAANEESETATPKKRRFGLGLAARRTESITTESESEPETAAENDGDVDDEAPAKRRSGLGGWFGRKKTDATANEADGDTEDANGKDAADGDSADDGEYVDPDSIDWNSLSKTEKRRLKKQIRRQDRAA